MVLLIIIPMKYEMAISLGIYPTFSDKPKWRHPLTLSSLIVVPAPPWHVRPLLNGLQRLVPTAAVVAPVAPVTPEAKIGDVKSCKIHQIYRIYQIYQIYQLKSGQLMSISMTFACFCLTFVELSMTVIGLS